MSWFGSSSKISPTFRPEPGRSGLGRRRLGVHEYLVPEQPGQLPEAIAVSICAVIWVLTPEIFPNRLRARAVSICTLANWATNFLGAFAFPWVVERFGMAAAFLAAAGICGVATAFFYLAVPETKGRSLEAIEAGWR